MGTLSILDIVLVALGWVALAFLVILNGKSSKYDDLFATLDKKEHPVKDFYGIGMAFMDLIGYSYKSARDRKMRAELSVLFGDKYVDYFLRVTYAQAATYAVILSVFGFILYGLSQEYLMIGMGFLFAFVGAYSAMTSASTKIKKRSDLLLTEFSEVTSQLALLTNAGMILHEAWVEVAYSSEGEIYDEMRKSCEDMNNGMPETEAVRQFGLRCMIPEAKKFATTLVQGMEKGNKELASMITAQSEESWTQKQQLARQAGEKANSKLLLPMFIMFAGILVMIVVPIFTNIGV